MAVTTTRFLERFSHSLSPPSSARLEEEKEDVEKGPAEEDLEDSLPLHHFKLPSRYLDLTLGHKPNNKWYLLFARTRYHSWELPPCSGAQQITRLDDPQLGSTTTTKTINTAISTARFWFNIRARTNWDHEGHSLLDALISINDPLPMIELTPTKRPLRAHTARQVDVVLEEGRLARWCEECCKWESLDLLEEQEEGWSARPRRRRWIAAGRDSFGLPVYLCPKCFAKDWFFARLKRRICRAFRRFFRK